MSSIHEVSVRSALINGKLVHSSTFRLLAGQDDEGKELWVKWTLPGIVSNPEDAVRILRANAQKKFACSAPKNAGTAKNGQRWESVVKATGTGEEYANIICRLCGVIETDVSMAALPPVAEPVKPARTKKTEPIVN